MFKGFLFVLIAAGSYSLFPIFSKIAYRAELEALDLLTWRFMIATTAIWLLWTAREKRLVWPAVTRRQTLMLIALGMLFTIIALMAFLSLERIPASTYTLLIYTYPAMVGIIGGVLGEKLPMMTWLAIGIALIGCALTVGGRLDVSDPMDVFLPLSNAAVYAVYLTIAGRYIRHIPGFTSGLLSITGSLLPMLVVLVVRGLKFPTTGEGWIAVFGIGLISSVVPILAMFEGINRIGAANASILSTIEPVFTVILAIILLHERVTLLQVLGGALILGSVIQLALSQSRTEPRLQPRLESVPEG